MDRWANKVAVVTGAGSGIGAQMARDLCAHKVIVVGLDFNKDLLEKVSREIQDNDPTAQFMSVLCDLTKEKEIGAAFEEIIAEKGGVDILVNCAAIITNKAILEEGSEDAISKVIQTNLLAVISCTKKAFKSMSDRDVEGQIVNMSSIMGHCALNLPDSTGSVYTVSKFAVTGLNRMLQKELVYFNKPKVRVSNISPGFVGDTEIRKEALCDFSAAPQLKPKDISNALIFILSSPTHAHVREIIIQAVGSLDY